MRKSFLSVLLVILTFVAPWPSAFAQGEWMVSLHGGQTNVDFLARSTGPLWTRIDDDETTLGASVSFEFLPELGMRLMYERTTGLNGRSVCPAGEVCTLELIEEDFDVDTWSVAFVPRLHLNEQWSLFATGGLSYLDTSSGTELPGDDDSGFSYGAGAAWRITPHTELALEYQRSEIDHETVRVNLGWRF